MRPRLYAELERIDRTLSVPRANCPNYTLGDAGLFLCAETEPGGYYCSPTNADRFAVTGGDGTHFSFLHAPGLSPENYPVVMTQPLSDHENIIVGASLREFLCLGCMFGYFSLQYLAYDDNLESTIDGIQSGRNAISFDTGGEPDHLAAETALLAAFRRELNLEPWPNVRGRLAQLREQWLGTLELPPP